MAKRDELVRYLELQDALLAREAERSLIAFVEQFWHVLEPDRTFVPNWHINLLCEHLQAITDGHSTRLLINLPPRYMKSLIVTVFWPTWEWIRHPTNRWIFASYAESLSAKHSLDRRTVIQSPLYQSRWGHIVKLAADQNVKYEFQNTRRGIMVATSLAGSITGKGGDRIVVDDPHNPTQVESDLQREAALTYFRRTLSTRLDSKKTGAIVVVGQRVHEQDLSALCIGEGYTSVVLPAEAETRQTIIFPRSGRRLLRDVGDLLWPDREGRAILDGLRRTLGSMNYAAQYQQRPVPSGGAMYKRSWFQWCDYPPANLELLISWDMTFKNIDGSDYVVGLVLGRCGAKIYLLGRVKGQWDFSQTRHQFERLAAQYPRHVPKLVEEAANGYAIISALSQTISAIIPVVPQGSKVARAAAAQASVEAGDVYLLNPAPNGIADPSREWVLDLLHQLTIFPKGPHDDDVDAFSQGMAYFMAHPPVEPLSTWQNPSPKDTERFDGLSAVLERMRGRLNHGRQLRHDVDDIADDDDQDDDQDE